MCRLTRLSSLLLLGLLGCSNAEAPPALYPVTGTLKVNGKPLENMTVQLSPVDITSKAKPGIGKTDAEGKFTILTNGDKGAATGKYKVILMDSPKVQRTGPPTIEELTKMNGEMSQKIAQKGAAAFEPPTLPFPKEWSDATTTPKEVEVGTQPVTVNIDI